MVVTVGEKESMDRSSGRKEGNSRHKKSCWHPHRCQQAIPQGLLLRVVPVCLRAVFPVTMQSKKAPVPSKVYWVLWVSSGISGIVLRDDEGSQAWLRYERTGAG